MVSVLRASPVGVTIRSCRLMAGSLRGKVESALEGPARDSLG